MIKILVADDSLTSRRWLYDLVNAWEDFEVIGEAHDGNMAFEMTKELQPDLILMDVSMPKMDGILATRNIMAHCPTPIVVISGADGSSADFNAIDVIRAGALDYLQKPGASIDRKEWENHFHETLRVASRVKVIRHGLSSTQKSKPSNKLSETKKESTSLVAIGASTGGPRVIANILGLLPPLPVPVILIIHIHETANQHLLDWYASVASMPVVRAEDGLSLESLKGKICVTESNKHLTVCEGFLKLSDEPARNYCKPSIDILFESIAKYSGKNALAILLTGMGEDGALGLLKVKEAGGKTLAQNEETSAVFGMPKVAIELDAAQEVLTPSEISNRIIEIMHVGKSG